MNPRRLTLRLPRLCLAALALTGCEFHEPVVRRSIDPSSINSSLDSLYAALAATTTKEARAPLVQAITCERLLLMETHADTTTQEYEMRVVEQTRLPDGRRFAPIWNEFFQGVLVGIDHHTCPMLRDARPSPSPSDSAR